MRTTTLCALLSGASSAAILMAAAGPAYAAYEYATSTTDCSRKVDAIGDGSDLRLPIGTSTLELWGDGLDFARSSSISSVSGTGTLTARIDRTRGGAENLGRGCGAKGSITVTFTASPGTVTSGFRRSVAFRDSGSATKGTVPVSVRRFPAPATAAWSNTFTGRSCLVASDTRVDNNATFILTLPPGHNTDNRNCVAALNVDIAETEDGQVDVNRAYDLSVEGLPSFLRPVPSGVASLRRGLYDWGQDRVEFTVDVPGIRALSAPSISTIRFKAPNGLASNTIRLEVRNDAGGGFAGALTAAPPSLLVGDPVDIRVPIAPAAPASGQRILFTAENAGCFELAAHPDAPDVADPNVRQFTISAG